MCLMIWLLMCLVLVSFLGLLGLIRIVMWKLLLLMWLMIG